jgi:tetratricopeptide (TPR) repeat protein
MVKSVDKNTIILVLMVILFISIFLIMKAREYPSSVERENQKSEKAIIDSSNFVEDEVSTLEYGLTAEDNLSKGTLALYFRDNNYELNKSSNAAIKYFSKAIELDPNYGEAYLMRGRAKIGVQDMAGAMIDLNEAVTLEPNNSEAITERGNVKQMVGNITGALDDYEKALQLNPKDPHIFEMRAFLWLYQNKITLACNDYFSAFDLGSQSAYESLKSLNCVQ